MRVHCSSRGYHRARAEHGSRMQQARLAEDCQACHAEGNIVASGTAAVAGRTSVLGKGAGMQKTVLQMFTELSTRINRAETDLLEAQNCLDQLAEQFGFVAQPVPSLPVRGPNPYLGPNSGEIFPSFTPAPAEG